MNDDDAPQRSDRGLAIAHLIAGTMSWIAFHSHIVHALALSFFVVCVALTAVRGDAKRRHSRYLILAGIACAAALITVYLPLHLVAPPQAPFPWLWWIITATSLVIAAVERRRRIDPALLDEGEPTSPEKSAPTPHDV